MTESEKNHLLERWDQTAPEIQRGIVLELALQIHKLETLAQELERQIATEPAANFVYAVGSNKKNKFTTDRVFGPQCLAEAERYCRERNTNNRIHASPAWWTVMKAPLAAEWAQWETVYADNTKENR